jgi:hypothetical protein
VTVRLSPDEWATLSVQADQWNSRLPENASASAQMTIAKLLRSGALRRKRPPSVVSVGIAAEALAEMKSIRADMARLGNMLKTWMEYGDGVFKGKGDRLKIARVPMGGELNSVRAVLQALELTTATLNDQAARLGEPRSHGD